MLVFFSISRALRPAQVIVSGLDKMQSGDLTVRLPHFQLKEWQRTSYAINALAINLQHLLSERKKLTFKLITMQDEERRYLARELHDEFGQCLASINMLATAISQTARQDCPVLVADAEHISKINQHMMDGLHTLLLKLRPSDIDELGLELSLNNLMIECNNRTQNTTQYQLTIGGQCQKLLNPYPITLFRIIQESLTNIAKHSNATRATIHLDIQAQKIVLNINDNGKRKVLPSVNTSGFGLLGIRERVDALNGTFTVNKDTLAGFSIQAIFPLTCNKRV